ncbi:putative U-box domain-containing protein 42 isoform X1 [Herrania umbratica]|uniref:RING-type E3 ubiquitin transferase n=1 Tax=Herrania umbratica TaxID=108875 RepID=A0A6J1B3J7_9ROSI|nr:putative U-box domain-containing protein 42 isoform X1 [Herrania umbratica]XP_021293219.1 putative U-box domain-containing protein 42 isoform X1 [Herrania umbratica]XP_021293220.1 putative U-box domain-containing protein 42 isoform X1 [Herrania umbratica]
MEENTCQIDNTSFASVFESLLEAISAIIESVACIEVEQENFIAVGCYLYRVFPAIMELQYTENTPKNTKEILQSLSQNVNLAKDLVEKCHKENHPVSDTELRYIIAQLEGAVKDIGECLCLIPSATYGGEKYAETAVQSLSEEMQNVHFAVKQPQVVQTKELELQMSFASEQPEKELMPIESDLYSVNVDVSVTSESSQIFSMPRLIDFLKVTSQRSQWKHENINKSLTTLPQVAHYIEPLYDTFFCPLTKQIMDDPVTIESGVTYEREAIMDWFEMFDHLEDKVCPTTGKKLTSRVLSTNVALKTTIEEWKDRNEAARIKVARAALTLASSDSMILEAIRDLQHICQRKQYNKVHVLSVGILPLLIKFLGYKDGDIRCAALELLRQLVEEDDEGKEMIAKTMDISTIIELLSSSHQQIRHASLLFLLELSRSQALGEKIGSATGAILMLIRIKYNRNVDSFASERADEILKNLEGYPDNIKQMAEYGFLEPLLNHLTEGSEEVQMEMANYLGEIILGHDSETYVAERASPSLMKMVQSGNSIIRKAAFKALAQISSYHPNGGILVEAGIVNIMAEELFIRRIYDEPMNSKKEAAAILANILESGVEHDNIQVNTHGLRISSDYVVYNIIYMLKNSTPDELNINLIRILLCLTKSPKPMATIISVVNETEASYSLIEIINNPHEQLGVAAIKLLIALAPHVGNTLAERLCKTRGQPENLIESPTETNHITEKQAVSAKFLSKLPHQNLTLNLALLNRNVVPTILQRIFQIQRSGTRTSRHATLYLESLVGILVRFTTTLYEPQILFLARTYNLTSVFTELLMKTSSDEVQKLSAIGLENLSLESINLSQPPQIKKTKFTKMFSLPRFLSSSSSIRRKIPVCPVHRGSCSSQDTFCLIDAKAVERLLACLDHENGEVVEASLAAICTLLDDKVDVDKSVSLLSEINAIQHILNVVKEHRQEGLWQKSFWMIEKFLVKGGNKSASDISQDRLLPASLVSAFHHGDGKTRQMAEKILRHLNRMPSPSTTYYTM